MNEREVPKQPAAPPAPVASSPTPPPDAEPFAATLHRMWARLRAHKVAQWTLAYLAVAYTLLHGAEMLAGSLGWPHGVLRVFTIGLILGVPVVATLAWYHGARGQQRASGTEVMIIAVLLAVGGAFLWRDRSTQHTVEQATAASSSQPAAPVDLPAVSQRSIAVLPFVDMSPEKNQEYFSDGLSEELLNLLSKVPDLRVAARTSSFYFKGKTVKLTDVARELQVAHVLEGSVRKAGDRVRITAQLVRASDGYHQWSETYDRTLEDIFAVQDEIAASVVSQLKVFLLSAPPTARKTSPEAYALYLQATQLERKVEIPCAECIALHQRVLAIDPNYTPALVNLAQHYALEANWTYRPLAEGMKEARALVNKALAIESDYASAHSVLGYIAQYYDQDLAAAAHHFERALTLDPRDMLILANASYLSLALGRADSLVPVGEYLISRDPLSPHGYAFLGFFYMYSGRLAESIASSREALRMSPALGSMHTQIGDALLLSGDYAAALSSYKKEPMEVVRLIGEAMSNHALGNKSESDTALSGLIEKYEDWAYSIACVFAYRGENDHSFQWLDRAQVNRDSGLNNLPKELFLRNLHDDPRWLPLLRKLGKAPEQLSAIKFDLKVPQH